MDVDNVQDEEADITSQSDLKKWEKARETLQDYEGRLTSGTLHLILQTICKTSKSPAAMVMDLLAGSRWVEQGPYATPPFR